MENKKLIENENERQRNRLDSIPIVTGMGIELPKDKDDRKRRRSEISENEISKMEVFKGLNGEDEEVVVIETRVISGLIENIEDENVRSLIECFNPILGGSPDLIKQQMLECSDKWVNKKDVYIGAINYIEHGRKDAIDRKEQLTDIGIERLREILIREIENRMPKLCKRCDEWYIVKLNDRPEIHCMWCKVGMHDCIEINEIIKSPGFKWMCDKCEPIFTKHFLPKLDQTASFDGFDTDKKIKNGKHVNKEWENSTSKEEIEDLEIIEMEEPSREDKRESNEGGSNQAEAENKESRKKDDETRNSNQNKREESTVKEICWFWKNRKCRYATNCNKEHPEQCKDMLETGLCKNSRCQLLHPKICRNQFYRGYCPRGDTCWFTHPSNCRNNQQNNNNQNKETNSNLGITSQHQNINNHTNQMINTNIGNDNRNMNTHFLGTWPALGNVNRNPGTNQMQPMMQMMQTMMERISRMDNKLIHLEMGRQIYS